MCPIRSLLPSVVLLCGALLVPSPARAQSPDPAALDKALGELTLDTAAARQVENVELHVGAGLLKLTKGALFPTGAVAGEAPELVFVGEARFTVTPPNAIEAGQLELFAKKRTFDEPLVAAILAGGDRALRDALGAALAAGQPVTDAKVVEDAKARFTTWSGPIARGLAVHQHLLQRALDPRYAGFTLAHLYQAAGAKANCGVNKTQAMAATCPVAALVLPEQPEQFVFGQPIRWLLDADDRFVAQYALDAARARGRSLGFSLDEMTSFDTWMNYPVKGADGADLPDDPGIDVTRYVLDLEVDKDGDGLAGTATLTLAAPAAGVKWIELAINPDLRVQSVMSASGYPYFFRQHGSTIAILLPDELLPTVPVDMKIAYRGTALVKLGWKRYQPTDTVNWYPRGPSAHGATFDATFRWPKKLDLVASGTHVDGGEKDGVKWEHRTLDIPALYFGFQIGDFEMDERTAGHVKLHIAFNRKWQSFVGPELKKLLASNLESSLAYYEQIFGPYPFDEMNVVMNEASFAQGLPGFVTLSTAHLEIVLHEVAHQWWGGIVKPKSRMHDNWLSEGMAEFVTRFALRHGKPPQKAKLGLGVGACDAQGPMWLGSRLDSSLAACAESATYGKGGKVLDMLAQIVGEGKFIGLLHAIVTTQKEPLSTEAFLAKVQRVTSQNVREFANAYVYGSGMNDLFYTYATEPDPAGGYRTKLVIEQEPWQSNEYAVDLAEDGTLDVVGTCRRHAPAPAQVVVPWELRPKPQDETPLEAREKADAPPLKSGAVIVRDAHTEMVIASAVEPRVVLDPMDVTVGDTVDQSAQPKQTLRWRAWMALCRGDLDAAESWAKRALEAPLTAEGRPDRSDRRLTYDHGAAKQDAWSQCALGTVRLRRKDLAGARAALDAAKKLYPDDVTKDDGLAAFEARVLLREGNTSGAYGVLWRSSQSKDAHPYENWALLAIAAKLQGEENWFKTALATAKKGEIDVHRLEEQP